VAARSQGQFMWKHAKKIHVVHATADQIAETHRLRSEKKERQKQAKAAEQQAKHLAKQLATVQRP
jgi:hypothetical protein